MHRPLLLVPFVAFLLAADAKDDDALKKEKAALRGKSKITKVQDWLAGNPNEKLLVGKIVLIDDAVITVKDGDDAAESDYTIDPTKAPKELTAVFRNGEDKGKTMKAIYQLDGDTLIICDSQPGKDRPKEFKPSETTQSMVVMLKRVTD